MKKEAGDKNFTLKQTVITTLLTSAIAFVSGTCLEPVKKLVDRFVNPPPIDEPKKQTQTEPAPQKKFKDIFDLVGNGTAIDLEELLKQHPDVEIRGTDQMTPLMLAAKKGDLGMVRLLVKQGARLNINKPQTALAYAALHGHAEVAEHLLEHGADPNMGEDPSRTPPLMRACEAGRADIVCNLLRRGAEVNRQNANGCTPLMDATDSNNPEIVSLLICYGADINLVDHGTHTRKTALMLAAEKGKEQMVRVMLFAKPNLSIKNTEHKTAIDLAREKGHQRVVDLLTEYQESTTNRNSTAKPNK